MSEKPAIPAPCCLPEGIFNKAGFLKFWGSPLNPKP